LLNLTRWKKEHTHLHLNNMFHKGGAMCLFIIYQAFFVIQGNLGIKV